MPRLGCEVPTVRPFRALRYDQADGRPARRARRAAVRRHLRRGAARLPRAQPVQRRPPDAARLASSRPAATSRAWRDAGRARRGRARRTGGSPRTTSAPTASPARARASPPRCPVTPYEAGEVLPHERTHAGPKEGRLRLLRATRTQLEPIFLLYDADRRARAARTASRRSTSRRAACARVPGRSPRGEIDDRHAAPDRRRPPPLRDRRRVPRGEPEATHTFAILVSSRAPGRRDLPDAPARRRSSATCPARRSTAPGGGVTLYRGGRYTARRDRRRLRPARRRVVRAATASRYTAYADEAVAAVDRGDAAAAFLLAAGDRRAGRALRARRRDDAAEVDVLLPEADVRPALPPGMTDWLALCRAARDDVARVLEELPRARRARAGRRRGRGRRRDDGDRRGRRARDPRALPRRGRAHRQRGGRRRGRRPLDGRRRPDRRLAEREARHPVLLDLDRGRRRRHDGRRRLRLRLRLRHAARSGRRRAAAARC